MLGDVVSSGTLLSEMRHLVEQARGRVVLAVSLINLQILDDQKQPRHVNPEFKRVTTIVSPSEFDAENMVQPCVQYFGHCDIPTALVSDDEVNLSKIKRIDMETVLPAQLTADIKSDPAFKPLMELNTVASLERKTVVGYFGNRDRVFSVHASIIQLLELGRHEIEMKLSDWMEGIRELGGDPVLVSTSTLENRQILERLSDFFEQKSIQPSFSYFLRLDELEGSYPFRFLDGEAEFKGKEVIVLLSTVQTSDTLRALSAQLSLFGCASIRVLCILNRMTPATTSFMARVLHLGEHSAKQNQIYHKPIFEFKSAYRVWDLASSDLKRSELYLARRVSQIKRNIAQPNGHNKFRKFGKIF